MVLLHHPLLRKRLKKNRKTKDSYFLIPTMTMIWTFMLLVGVMKERPVIDRYQDRLYNNDGHGKFKLNNNALPSTVASGSCVRAADYDADGDLDLFVGGRVVAGSYPLPSESYLLRNDKGKFTDVTAEVSKHLKYSGMITDALWSDFDGDNKIDLIVAGEFMPVMLYKNTANKLVRIEDTGFENYSGWWNSITGADFDKDGDTDYIIGNLGLNNYYNISDSQPLRVYAKDFDSNESVDAIVSCYFKSEEEDMQEYPVHFWDELNSQSPKFRNQFSSYKQYGKTSMENLLRPYDTTGMLVLKVNYANTSYAENIGKGKFTLRPLPRLAQVAPINGLVTMDVNSDGNLDVFMSGNDYGNEVFSGRYDAGTGLLLLGKGNGEFDVVPSVTSGFKVNGDAKALAKLKGGSGNELLLATQNLDSLRAFTNSEQLDLQRVFQPLPFDSWAELDYENGKKEKVEFYYGSGYLSQSTRSLIISQTVAEIIVYDFKGNQRTIEYGQLAFAESKKN